MPLLEELSADQDHWLASYGSLLIMFWLGEVTPGLCLGLPRVARDLAARQRESKVSVLSLSLPNAIAPSRESRRALAALSRDSEASIARVAVIRDGQGFVASTVASIAAGISMLSRTNVLLRAFSSVGPATLWATEPLRQFQGKPSRIQEAIVVVTRKHQSLVERTRRDGLDLRPV